MDGESTFVLRDPEGSEELASSLELREDEFPNLTSLLLGPKSDEIQAELITLIRRFRKRRASRRQIEHSAKLVVADGSMEFEEAVNIEDISSSGIRVAISKNVELDLVRLMDVRLLIELRDGETSRVVNLEAWFIRIADVSENAISLAFRFSSITQEEVELLELDDKSQSKSDRSTLPTL